MTDFDTLSLSGTWKVRSAEGQYELNASVPGSLMEELEKIGAFGENGLFFGENNRVAERIARREFVFSRDVEVPMEFLGSKKTSKFYLEADGLDTLATIRINDVEIARTENMHRRYRFEVGSILKTGTNHIEIEFGDALAYIEQKQAERSLWHAYWQLPQYATQGFNRIRKSHCSFGWDWGPIVPDVGIWRDLRIVRYEYGRMGIPLIRQHHEDGAVRLRISVPVELWDGESTARSECSVKVEIGDPFGEIVAAEKGPLSTEIVLTVEDPLLWWPAGLGDQHLYRVKVAFERGGMELQASELNVGLRTLGVSREKDEWGESFALVVNGTPFFARGADWIPEDVYLTRPTPERTERLIADAARANFNCLRVWGGGIYPPNLFYDLCDRYGLVVWQDLMFACATYDVKNRSFLTEIVAEVEDNLERLRHHASLGLVCGNNEMETAFVDWGFPHTNEMRTEYLKQYQFVFPEIAARVAPDTFYWPASPSSGGDFEAPNDPDHGDTHFWEVWHGNKDFKEYEKHFFRFMSEFGFESFPSMKTVESFTRADDRNIFSPVMEDHQRCLDGNQRIFSYLSKYFRFPKDLPSLVYLSQISQAEAIRSGTEHWRRNRGRCMGAVYWQYNDNWPVASWSSVDYYGRWKALHYRAKRFFSNALLSCPVEGMNVELHLSNESKVPISGEIFWRLVDVSGAVLEESRTAAAAAPFSSSRVVERDFSVLRERKRRILFFYSFLGDDGSESEGAIAFVPYKHLELEKSTLTIKETQETQETQETEEDRGETVLYVSARTPALFVELDDLEGDVLFSDNFFHLDGVTEKRIVVERKTSTCAVWSSRTLRDTY